MVQRNANESLSFREKWTSSWNALQHIKRVPIYKPTSFLHKHIRWKEMFLVTSFSSLHERRKSWTTFSSCLNGNNSLRLHRESPETIHFTKPHTTLLIWKNPLKRDGKKLSALSTHCSSSPSWCGLPCLRVLAVRQAHGISSDQEHMSRRDIIDATLTSVVNGTVNLEYKAPAPLRVLLNNCDWEKQSYKTISKSELGNPGGGHVVEFRLNLCRWEGLPCFQQ